MKQRPSCAYDPCGRPANGARGYCIGHYDQVRTGRELAPLKRNALTPEARFYSYVEKTDDCWLWNGSKSGKGYGAVYWQGKQRLAHRVAYEMAYGEVPEGKVVDHICHVRNCVNPKHLQAVTNRENLENHSGATRRSKTGVRGVSFRADTQKYIVQVMVNGVQHRKGLSFDTLEEAAEVARNLRLKLHTNNLADRATA